MIYLYILTCSSSSVLQHLRGPPSVLVGKRERLTNNELGLWYDGNSGGDLSQIWVDVFLAGSCFSLPYELMLLFPRTCVCLLLAFVCSVVDPAA